MSEFRPIIQDLPTEPLNPKLAFPQDEDPKKPKDQGSETVIELQEYNDEDEFYEQEVTARRVTPILVHLSWLLIVEAILITPILILIFSFNVNLRSLWKNRFETTSERLKQEGTQQSTVDAETSTKFFLWACLTVFIWVNTSYWLSAIPQMVIRVIKLFKRTASEKVKRRLEYYVAAAPMLKVSFASAWSVGIWVLMFPYAPQLPRNDQYPRWELTIFRILLCLLTWALLISIEKLIVQVIAVRFHQTAYKDRIKESKYGSYILDRLSKAKYNKSEGRIDGSGRNSNIGTPTGSKFNTTSSYFPDSKPKSHFHSKFEDAPTASDSIDLHSQFEAKRVARKLFSALRGGRSFLIVDDFLPYFPKKEDAEKAFNYLDKDGNGDLTKVEMVEKISSIYKERKDLALALRDTTQAVGKLDNIFLVLVCFISIWICLIFFNVYLWNILVPFGTLILGLSFVFSASASEFFQSIIFLFAMHPYDAGDRVVINNETMFVNKIGLLGTQFTHSNGQIIYLPHALLRTQFVYNMRRAVNQGEQINFEMAFDTPSEKIDQLREKIETYLKFEETRDFFPEPTIALYGVENANIMKWFVWLQHKSNWQDGGKRWIRTTRFTLALRRFCHELDIQYKMPPQPVEYMYHDPSAHARSEFYPTLPSHMGVLPHTSQH